MYESDHTKFIRDLMSKKPELAQKQQEGRSIWWEKDLNRELYQDFAAAKVPQSPYVYQNFSSGEDKNNATS